YTCGKKAHDYFSYRDVAIERYWEGFSFRPRYADAKEIGECLISEFLRPTADGGVDELHLVFTRFKSLVSQQTQIVRLLPLVVVQGDSDDPIGEAVDGEATQHDAETRRAAAEYFFEPSASIVLDRLLPLYIINRLRFALMEAAASELAARQQAMHSATDNAKQLIDTLTRDANQARQAEITQEINEIVGGAGALTAG
ncbi:MAG: F0F1 ATP synthase subunit gamma, partial [Propionibacteriaceae bacterium]|nr:F0F1 ATP synthase subunit gamma [Propionibacteriaceae bacterium]